MAQDNDWDVGALDNFDFDSGFPNIEGNITKDRRPAQQAKYIASKSLKGVGKGFLSQTQSLVSRGMPNTASALRDVRDFGSEAKSLYDDFKRDAGKSVDTFKSAGRKMLPSVKKLIPQGIYDKLDKALVPESTRSYNKEQQIEQDRESVIAQSIEETFRQGQRIDAAERNEDRINKSIDRQLSMTKFNTSQRSLNYITTFMGTSFTAYMKKSIELKYKHLFVAQDTLATTRFTAQLLERKLEEIKHNTSLPDIDKSTKLEELKARMFRRAADSISSKASGFSRQILKNLKTQVFDKALDGVTSAADMASMMGDNLEMLREMGDISGGPDVGDKTRAAGFAGGVAGEFGGNWLAKKLSKHPHVRRLIKTVAPFVRDSESFFANNQANTMLKMQQWKSDNQYAGGFKSLLSDIIPDTDINVRTKNALETDAGDRALFDNITRTSIVEIIPGWLSKISRGIYSIFKGREQEEEIYDFTKRDFVKSSTFKKNMTTYLHGSTSERSERIGAAVGTVNTFYSTNEGSSAGKISDKINKGIERVLLNHATYIKGLIPKHIKKYANGGTDFLDDDYDWSKEVAYEDYIHTVFKGVEEPEAVAMVLTKALYSDGTLNIQAVEAISGSIIKEMNASNFRGKYEYLFDTHGLSRYFKDDIGKSGNVDLDKVIGNKTKGLDTGSYKYGFYGSQRKILTESIDKSKENRHTLDELQGKKDNIPFADKIMDYLRKGVIDEESAGKLLTSVEEAYRSSYSDKPSASKKRRRYKGAKGNTIDLSSGFSDTGDFISILESINATAFQFHEDFLNSLGKTPEPTEQRTEVLPNRDQAIVEGLKDLKDSIIPIMTERKDVDYTTLDYIIRIHDKMRSGEKATSDDRRMFTYLSKTNIKDKGNSFISWMKRKWRKSPDATGGIHDKDATKKEDDIDDKESKLGGIGEGIGGFIKNLTSGGGGMGKKIITTALPFMLFGPMGGLLFHDAIRGFKGTRAIAGLGLGALGGVLKAPGKLFGFAKGKFDQVAPKFFDIHRKDKLDPGNPLLSAKTQEEGIFFEDGTEVKESKDIDKPVFDRDKKILITEEDLKAGLVNSDGMPINIFKTVKKGFFSFGKKAKDKGDELTEKIRSGEAKEKIKAEYDKILEAAKKRMEDAKGTPEYARAKAEYEKIKAFATESIGKGKKYASDKASEIKGAGKGLGDVKIGGVSLKHLGIGAAFIANPMLGLLALGASHKGTRDKVGGIFNRINPFSKKEEDGEEDPSSPIGALKRKARAYRLQTDQYKGIIKRLDQIVKNTKSKTRRFDEDESGTRIGSYADRLKKTGNAFKNKSAGVINNLKNRLSGKGGQVNPDGTPVQDNDSGGMGIGGFLGGLGAWEVAKKAGGYGMSKGASAAKWGWTAGRAALGLGGSTILGGGVTAAANAAALEAVVGGGALAAGSTAVGTAATAGGVTAGGVLAGVGGTVATVLASPAVLIGLGILGTAAVGYGIYRYLKPSKGGDELLSERMKLYGIPGNIDPDYVRRLERRIYDYTIGEEGSLTPKEIDTYMSRFNLRSQSESTRAQFLDWLGHRFIPMFRGFIEALNSTGQEFKKLDKIDNEDPNFQKIKQAIIKAMSSATVSGIEFRNIGKDDSALQKEDKAFSGGGPTTISDAADKVNQNSKNIDKRVNPNLDTSKGGQKVTPVNLKSYNLDPNGNILDALELHSTNQIFAINEVRDELIRMRKLMESGQGFSSGDNEKGIFDKIKDFFGGSGEASADTGQKTSVSADYKSMVGAKTPSSLDSLQPKKEQYISRIITNDDGSKTLERMTVDEYDKRQKSKPANKAGQQKNEKSFFDYINDAGRSISNIRDSKTPINMNKGKSTGGGVAGVRG